MRRANLRLINVEMKTVTKSSFVSIRVRNVGEVMDYCRWTG
jgi:hypothetical protein